MNATPPADRPKPRGYAVTLTAPPGADLLDCAVAYVAETAGEGRPVLWFGEPRDRLRLLEAAVARLDGRPTLQVSTTRGEPFAGFPETAGHALVTPGVFEGWARRMADGGLLEVLEGWRAAEVLVVCPFGRSGVALLSALAAGGLEVYVLTLKRGTVEDLESA